MSNNTPSTDKVSPTNKFWVWIVVALASTVSAIALWGDNQKDKLITTYRQDSEDCGKQIKLKDSVINKKNIEIDTLRIAYYQSQANSVDKLIEYDNKLKKLQIKTSQDNEKLLMINNMTRDNIKKLTKIKNELKN